VPISFQVENGAKSIAISREGGISSAKSMRTLCPNGMVDAVQAVALCAQVAQREEHRGNRIVEQRLRLAGSL
jgi:hypothetical protein